MTITYPNAFDVNENIINIDTLSKETLDKSIKYYCISCQKELIPRLGRKKSKHFAHKADVVNCSQETYFHKLAKLTFYNEYQKCLDKKIPFHLEFRHTTICTKYKDKYNLSCQQDNIDKYDLTRTFSRIELEKEYNGFRPDILLSNQNRTEVIFIEMAVSHFLEEDKIKSGNKIIEIKIDNEVSIKFIESHTFPIKEQNIKLENFEFKNTEIESCTHNLCPSKLTFFIINTNGKCDYIDKTPQEIEQLNHKPSILYAKYVNPKISIIEEIKQAYKNGIKFQNCFLCKYHKLVGWKSAISCRFLKKEYDYTYGNSCNEFSLRDDL